jgi:hypothetical protein
MIKKMFFHIWVLHMVMGIFNLWADCHFYNTVTLADFKDPNYINGIKNLNIGFELALLTPIADQLKSREQYQKDLEALKVEITNFIECFKQFQIPISTVRIHQPAGYTYQWYDHHDLSGFDFLSDFFTYCSELGFSHYVIHTPFGDAKKDLGIEMRDFSEKLHFLSRNGEIEVEEIVSSNYGIKQPHNLRFYNGSLFEFLLANQKATMLLDVHECGGANKTVARMIDLKTKGFELHSIHLHKDKHKILPNEELTILLKSNFDGNFINEGFLKNESSWDEFAKTKSSNCIVPNDQRIEILRGYVTLKP